VLTAQLLCLEDKNHAYLQEGVLLLNTTSRRLCPVPYTSLSLSVQFLIPLSLSLFTSSFLAPSDSLPPFFLSVST
jgi:hypothetical protein